MNNTLKLVLPSDTYRFKTFITALSISYEQSSCRLCFIDIIFRRRQT